MRDQTEVEHLRQTLAIRAGELVRLAQDESPVRVNLTSSITLTREDVTEALKERARALGVRCAPASNGFLTSGVKPAEDLLPPPPLASRSAFSAFVLQPVRPSLDYPDVRFSRGDWKRPDHNAPIERAVMELQTGPTRIVLTGFADTTPTANRQSRGRDIWTERNEAISWARAEALKCAILDRAGARFQNRIDVQAFGESVAACSDSSIETDACMDRNRRVSIEVDPVPLRAAALSDRPFECVVNKAQNIGDLVTLYRSR